METFKILFIFLNLENHVLVKSRFSKVMLEIRL